MFTRLPRGDEFGVIAALLVLVLVIGAFHPNFLHWVQLVDVVEQAAFVGILACGMTFLLALRELDLSVGSGYALPRKKTTTRSHSSTLAGADLTQPVLLHAMATGEVT